ncbi:MAG: hypothetical protein ABIH11_04460 [Candidatus Altiarchaeota archaeon]
MRLKIPLLVVVMLASGYYSYLEYIEKSYTTSVTILSLSIMTLWLINEEVRQSMINRGI